MNGVDQECKVFIETKKMNVPLQKHILWNGREYESYSFETILKGEVLLSKVFMRLCTVTDPSISHIERPFTIPDTREYFSRKIPLELLPEITKFLDLKSIFSLCLTEKYLNSNFHHLFYPHKHHIAEILKIRFISQRFLLKFGAFVHDLGLSQGSFSLQRLSDLSCFSNLRMVRFMIDDATYSVDTMPTLNKVVYIEFEYLDSKMQPISILPLISKAPFVRYLHFGTCNGCTEEEIEKAICQSKYLEGLHIDFRLNVAESCFEKIIDQIPHVKYLTCLGNLSANALEKMAASCNRLEILNLSSSAPIEKDLALRIIKANPSLRLVTIHSRIESISDLTECIAQTPNLQNISFENIRDCTDEGVKEILEKLIYLQSLCLQAVESGINSDELTIPFESLVHLVPQLQHLQILSTQGTREESIVKFLSTHPFLSSLFITATECALSDKILEGIYQNKLDLMNLFIEGNCSFSKNALLHVIKSCTKLTFFSLQTSSLTDEDLFELIDCGRQISLLVCTHGFIKDTTIVDQFNSFANLEVIYFRHFAGDSIDPILSFLSKCPNLLAIIFEGPHDLFSELNRKYRGKADIFTISADQWKNAYQERIWGKLITDFLLARL